VATLTALRPDWGQVDELDTLRVAALVHDEWTTGQAASNKLEDGGLNDYKRGNRILVQTRLLAGILLTPFA
jgi:hypothetical protein